MRLKYGRLLNNFFQNLSLTIFFSMENFERFRCVKSCIVSSKLPAVVPKLNLGADPSVTPDSKSDVKYSMKFFTVFFLLESYRSVAPHEKILLKYHSSASLT